MISYINSTGHSPFCIRNSYRYLAPFSAKPSQWSSGRPWHLSQIGIRSPGDRSRFPIPFSHRHVGTTAAVSSLLCWSELWQLKKRTWFDICHCHCQSACPLFASTSYPSKTAALPVPWLPIKPSLGIRLPACLPGLFHLLRVFDQGFPCDLSSMQLYYPHSICPNEDCITKHIFWTNIDAI